jgi:hypothetical protein
MLLEAAAQQRAQELMARLKDKGEIAYFRPSAMPKPAETASAKP